MPRLQNERRRDHREIWGACDNIPENGYRLSAVMAKVWAPT